MWIDIRHMHSSHTMNTAIPIEKMNWGTYWQYPAHNVWSSTKWNQSKWNWNWNCNWMEQWMIMKRKKIKRPLLTIFHFAILTHLQFYHQNKSFADEKFFRKYIRILIAFIISSNERQMNTHKERNEIDFLTW